MTHMAPMILALLAWGPARVASTALALLALGPLGATSATLGTLAMMQRTHLQTQTSVSVALSRRRAAKKLAYFGRILVGEPPQEFSVVYDTGSGNLIIPGQGCGSLACQNHDRFSERSSHATRINCDGAPLAPGVDADEITITFGTGYISGHCLQDKICIGSACSVGSFIASTDESDQPFSSFAFDGVLGLSLESMAQSPSFSLMTRLTQTRALRLPMFGVFLSDSDLETSEITFGDVKHEHMASELFWVPVTGTSGYWEVRIEDITFGTEPQSLCTDCRVAVDTGTSQLAGPTALMERLTRSLNVASDCSNYEKLPNLGFIVGGRILSLSPSDYVDVQTYGGGRLCQVGFMSIDVPPPRGPLFVFGIPFLQKFYTVYDSANSQVGFAVARHKGEKAVELVTVGSRRTPARPPTGAFLAARAAVNKSHDLKL